MSTDRPTFETYDVDSFRIDYSQYGNYAGLLDENGQPIDYNGDTQKQSGPINKLMSWGNGIKKKERGEIISAQLAAQATVDAAIIESQTAAYVAETESEASVNSVIVQAEASMYSDDKALEGIQTQAETDLAVAQLEYDLGVEQNKTDLAAIEVDKMNAEANQIASQALVVEAEAERTEAEAERDEVKYDYLYDNSSSSWG